MFCFALLFFRSAPQNFPPKKILSRRNIFSSFLNLLTVTGREILQKMFATHATQGQPADKVETVIVEAFGARKCPKLVEQMQSDKPIVRRNALSVLCDEMHNPASVHGCCEAGMVAVLNSYISSSEDAGTRERASKALSIAAMDAVGRQSMLDHGSASSVAAALDDTNVIVRCNVYDALINFSRGPIPCLRAIIAAKYASVLVAKAANEVPGVQPLVLRLLYSCIKDDSGLDDALGASAVDTCIGLLELSNSRDVKKEAATTLGFLCFSDMAKMEAIKGGAVGALSLLLAAGQADTVQAAAAGALMTVTTTDEAKKSIVDVGGVLPLIALLSESTDAQRLLRLNVLKTIANVVVNPRARALLRESEAALPTLCEIEEGDDALVAKHAAVAKAALLWEP